MNVIIASYNIIPQKSHLMPWRYVCEVANYFKSHGHQALIVSIDQKVGQFQLNDVEVPVKTIRKDKSHIYHDLGELVKSHNIDLIYWPLSWREPGYRLAALKKLNIPLIGYFPGGVYALKQTLYAITSVGIRGTLPYIVEAIIPKRSRVKKLMGSGFRHIIALTDLTAKFAIKQGWPSKSISVTLPGKETERVRNISDLPNSFIDWLDNSRYLVFMGPPTPIRGIYELLRAFDIAANIDPTIRLVCLFRSDLGVDQATMKDFIASMKNSTKIYAVWQSLDRELLEAYISHSYAIALPFVLVPSEIPLALIDAASYGKPVITTNCGGSGEYVKQYGVSVDLTNKKEFSENILKIFHDQDFYKSKSSQAKMVYDNHPDWDDMSSGWLDIATKVAG